MPEKAALEQNAGIKCLHYPGNPAKPFTWQKDSPAKHVSSN